MAQAMEVLQTPEERFTDLPDYPYRPNYLMIEQGIRMHYLDEGKTDGPLLLLLHGEPTWSYLFRNMIPVFVQAGYRVIAPDLIGFGKSDKPVKKEIYTYQKHTQWLQLFVDQLQLKQINLYAHDWGGMIGLRIVATHPYLFKKVAVSYAFLFTGTEQVPESFSEWQHFSQTDAQFLAGSIVDWGTNRTLPEEIKQAYNAPFPDDIYKAAARQFPVLIPTHKEDAEAKINVQLREKLKAFDKPFLTIWGNNADAMWVGKDKVLQQEIPGAANQAHRILQANHFLQEDTGDEVAAILAGFFSY